MSTRNHSLACTGCGFTNHCICAEFTRLDSLGHFALLQHQREADKKSNTGQLMSSTIPSCSTVIWSRTEPPKALINQLNDPAYSPWLVFPSDQQQKAYNQDVAIQHIQQTKRQPLFLLIDATWQEARKMVRKSPWLSHIPRLEIDTQAPSSYRLRRNQADGNLCTCEVGCALLDLINEPSHAVSLSKLLETFQSIYQAEQQHQTLMPYHREGE